MIDYNTFKHEVFYFLEKKWRITQIREETDKIIFYFEKDLVCSFSTLHLEHFYNIEINRGNGITQAIDFFSSFIEQEWLRRIKK